MLIEPSAAPTMSNEVKRYIAVGHKDCLPNTSIVLGNIIVDPSKPEEPLNASSRIPVPDDLIQRPYQKGWKEENDKQRAVTVGLYTKFLSFLGPSADVKYGIERGDKSSLEVGRLQTEYFEPNLSYITQSLSTSPVLEFINKTDFKKRLYMIIGTKVAYGAKAGSSKTRGHDVDVSVSISGLPASVPIEGGPETSISTKRTTDVSFEESSPFVLAFRLREIRYSKRKNMLVVKDPTKGASYSLKEYQQNDAVTPSEGEMFAVNVAGISGDDLGADDLDVDGIDAIDEVDGATCEIVPPIGFE